MLMHSRPSSKMCQDIYQILLYLIWRRLFSICTMLLSRAQCCRWAISRDASCGLATDYTQSRQQTLTVIEDLLDHPFDVYDECFPFISQGDTTTSSVRLDLEDILLPPEQIDEPSATGSIVTKSARQSPKFIFSIYDAEVGNR